jgi:hypothetical protein
VLKVDLLPTESEPFLLAEHISAEIEGLLVVLCILYLRTILKKEAHQLLPLGLGPD